MSTEIYLPCEVFVLETVVGTREHLSKLESLFLEAVHAGMQNFDELRDLFQIGHRVTLDLVLDLWRREYIHVEVDRGRITLTDRVIECMRPEGTLCVEGFTAADGSRVEGLEGGDTRIIPVAIQQELMSGQLFRPQRHYGRTPAQQIAPAALQGSLDGVARQVLFDVLDSCLQQARARENAERPDGLPFHVRSVNLGGRATAQTDPSGRRPLLALRVDCTRDPDTERLAFKIVHPVTLPRRVVSGIEDALNKQADTLSDHVFYRRLAQEAELKKAVTLGDPLLLTGKLLGYVETLDEVDVGTVEQRHEDLSLRAEAIEDVTAEYLTTRTAIAVVAAPPNEEVRRCIGAAERQIVIATSEWNYDAFVRELQRPLEAAMRERKVRVYVLWGIDDNAGLDERLMRLFEDLAKQHHERFVFSRSASRVASTFIVKDADCVVLATSQFLRDWVGTSPTLTLTLTPNRAGLACHPALRLLDHARSAYETMAYSRGMMWLAEDFDLVEATTDGQPPPEAPEVDKQGTHSRAALGIWRAGWFSYVAWLRARVTEVDATCQILTGGRHADFVWPMIREVQRRLLIVSRRIDAGALGNTLVNWIGERVRHGVHVVIVYEQIDESLHTRLHAVYREHHRRLVLKQVPELHMELIVADDAAVITSFAILSTRHGRRRYSETGVLLRGTQVADPVLAALRKAFPAIQHLLEAPRSSSPEPSAAAPPKEASRPPPGLQELFARLQAAKQPRLRTEEVRIYFQGLPDGRAVEAALQVLADVELEDVSLFIAGGLTARPWGDPEVDGERWLAVLATEQWYIARDPFATDLLIRGFAGSPPGLPPAWVRRLAMLRADPPSLLEPLQEAALASQDVAAASCVASLAITMLLRDGFAAAVDCLAIVHDALPTPLAGWAAAACSYHRATLGRAVPYEMLAMRRDRRHIEGEARLTRQRLREALAAARNASFLFRLGQHTWAHLCAPQGPLTLLEQIAEEGSAPKAEAWLTNHRDPDAIIDAATRAIYERHAYHDRTITFPKRGSLLARLSAVVDAAHAWVKLSRELGRRRKEAIVDADLTRLAADLRIHRGDLETLCGDLNRDRRYEGPLLRGLLDDLTSLLEVTA